MKKINVLAAMFCLCFQAIAVFAATPDYSGVWELDAGRSMMPAAMPFDSMTLRVAQTEKELRIETTTKTTETNASDTKRKTTVSKLTEIFNLEGNDMTTFDVGSGATAGNEARKASVTGEGKLNLTTIRNFNNQTANAAMKTNDIWELLDEGKSLKITRYTESARGAANAEMFFTKKSTMASSTAMVGDNKVYQGAATGGANNTPKVISCGVLNGKAASLPKPAYPAEARAAGASGAVNVKVTIDENGNVISAEAVSGDALLRAACVEAAKKAKFAPTRLSGNPVKVTGVLVYNFVP